MRAHTSVVLTSLLFVSLAIGFSSTQPSVASPMPAEAVKLSSTTQLQKHPRISHRGSGRLVPGQRVSFLVTQI